MKKISNPFRRIGNKKISGDSRADNRTPDDFDVNIRNSEPILTLLTDRKGSKVDRILWTVVSAAVPALALAVLLDVAGSMEFAPYLLTGVAVYVIFTLVGSRISGKKRAIAGVVTVIVLIAALVVLRKYIGNGLALLVNQLYEYAEYSQAYVYNMYSVGDIGYESSDACIISAVIWVSVLTGLVTALPRPEHRRIVNSVVLVAVMICLAYFGVIPTGIIIAALVIVFMLSCGSGSIVASVPLLLIVGLLIGAITMIDPGESYTVSRANENIRDRLAFRTAYVENYDNMENEYDFEGEDKEDSGFLDFLAGDDEEGGQWIIYVLIAAIVLIAGAIIFFVHRRLDRKRKAIRQGIDSRDPNTAIGAMFPYLVRWLKIFGIEAGKAPYSSYIPAVRENMMSGYSERYEKMLGLWKEAVYSDHELTESDRLEMENFMKETVSAARNRANWKDKLKIRLRYAW